MTYLVQAILFDGDNERVINSTITEDFEKILNHFMFIHKNSYKYKYFVMEMDSQNVVEYPNIFQLY